MSFEQYKSYWTLVNHEHYVSRKAMRQEIPFSVFESDCFLLQDVLDDESANIEKILEMKWLLEDLEEALLF
ncbi:hypothetical protein ABQH43_00725 [Streptococcus sp. ZJ100]|uniref:hypothetical protein n=1 Tax=Streptococcus handemini TaxID=3161188 RepID=UPI0032EA9EA1